MLRYKITPANMFSSWINLFHCFKMLISVLLFFVVCLEETQHYQGLFLFSKRSGIDWDWSVYGSSVWLEGQYFKELCPIKECVTAWVQFLFIFILVGLLPNNILT